MPKLSASGKIRKKQSLHYRAQTRSECKRMQQDIHGYGEPYGGAAIFEKQKKQYLCCEVSHRSGTAQQGDISLSFIRRMLVTCIPFCTFLLRAFPFAVSETVKRGDYSPVMKLSSVVSREIILQ